MTTTGFREVGFRFDEPQAYVLKARLEDAGVWCDVRPADNWSLGVYAIGAFFPVSVRVRELDYERAMEVLGEEAVEWDAIDVGDSDDPTVRHIAGMSDDAIGRGAMGMSHVVCVMGAILGGIALGGAILALPVVLVMGHLVRRQQARLVET